MKKIPGQGKEGPIEVTPKKGTTETALSYVRKSERGIALVVVLVLSTVALALMTALIYMITTGTKISGFQKRYKTSVEASKGGSDLFYMLVALRGEDTATDQYVSDLDSLHPFIPARLNTACTGTSMGGMTYQGLRAKLMTPRVTWSSACDSSLSIDPNNPATYDMRLELGETNIYNYYAKIVDTIEGNTGTGGKEGSGKFIDSDGKEKQKMQGDGVVSSGLGEIQPMQKPYLYAMEVMATNSTNTNERSRFSILYQH